MSLAIQDEIFAIASEQDFNRAALAVFAHQREVVPVYRQYCDYLKKNPDNVKHWQNIPFLPISFFKSHNVIAGGLEIEAEFTSSGTTGMQTSRHKVHSLQWYRRSFMEAFQSFYGNISDYCVLALLPSYLEREGSSLVLMAEELIAKSNNPDSGFYLYDFTKLSEVLQNNESMNQKTILLGVTYALLDFAESNSLHLKNTIVMETGGMKGRRKEMVREEVHQQLCKGFGVQRIHSEYGMTELLSQGYSNGNGIFETPPWMKIAIRDTHDPFSFLPYGKTGGVNIIDLANYHSCSFIETQDLGIVQNDGSFTVVGRFDQSDIRGCNLMVGV